MVEPVTPPWADVVRETEAGRGQAPRAGHDTAALVAAFPELGGVTVTTPAIDGPHGAVPARLYRPRGPIGDAALVWVHGGAYIWGDLDMPESNWVGLALAARGIPVLALDYRKALHGVHHPVPSDDVLAGWSWAATHAGELRVPPDRLHLGGASAGANLVTGVTLRLRAARRPLPRSLVLAYPTMHPELPAPGPELAAALAAWPGYDPALPRVAREVNRHHVADDAGMSDPIAFPALADLAGLPPACLVNAELDGLRASADAFALQLAEAGVPVRCAFEPGATHGQLNEPFEPVGQRSLGRIADWLLGGWRTASADGSTTA